MALEDLWFLCLLSLGLPALSVQDKSFSLELSCGTGPVQVVLEPTQSLLLDCELAAVDRPVNVSWVRDGLPVVDSEVLRVLPNGSLALLPALHEWRMLDRGGGGASVEGGYSCISTNAFGAVTSRTVMVHLSSLSRFLSHPEPHRVPVGGAARFQCHVDGLPAPLITWEKDQAPLPAEPRFIPLPSGVLQVTRVQEEDEGTYRCVASNSARKRYSQDAQLSVTPGPPPSMEEVVILVSPRNTTVVSGQTAVMECMAQAEPTPFVSWIRQDGKPISTEAVVLATNLMIIETQPHHAGVYVCRANKPKTREFVMAAAELRVLAPPVIFQTPETVSLSRGNTARFLCNSSGEPSPTLRWLKNGAPILSNGRVKTQSPGILLINQIGLSDAGYYQCVAENSLGTACATAKLSVIVREGLPSAPRIVSALPTSSSTTLLSWERPEHNSDQIIGFSVHYQKAVGSDNMEYQFAVNNETTEFPVRDLQPNTAYTFYMVAYSPMGASRTSASVTVHTLEDVPSAPPQLSLLSTSPTDIRVMWQPLSAELSRGTLIRYRIDYCPPEDEQVYSLEVAGNETQVTLPGLHPNRLYRVRIVAGTRAGFGMPSDWTLHRTPDRYNHSMVLFAPTELKVKAKMDSLHVTWQPPANHAQISGYKLYYREAELEEPANEESPETPRGEGREGLTIRLRKKVKQYDITGLVPDRLYEVKVRAFNKQADGYAAVWKGRTERAPVTVGPGVHKLPPLPPSGIQASANSSTTIWLRWERPRFSAIRIINYTVRCSPSGLKNASLVSYHTSSAQEILLGALKPFTLYELAVQSNGQEVDGPFSKVVQESTLPDRPSTPPSELKLSPLNPYAVLVRWRPPLEPNGIIVVYSILYSSNSSQPDSLWSSLTREGNIFSAEVQGLQSATRYFFKMSAWTVVGAGPFTQVKDVHTLLDKRPDPLDVHSVTGIIVGVCLGLLCILLCMCISFRSSKARELSGGLDSSALPPQYRKVPVSAPDCHELETLMSPRAEDSTLPLTEVTELTEEQSLMGTSLAEDSLPLEPKPAWNGSVSRNWANNITSYRDTITDDCTVLSNGLLSPSSKRPPERALDNPASDCNKGEVQSKPYSAVGSNQVEAEVIVHSELSEPEGEWDGEGDGSGGRLSYSDGDDDEGDATSAPEQLPESPVAPDANPLDSRMPAPKTLTNHSDVNGDTDGEEVLNTARWKHSRQEPSHGSSSDNVQGLSNGFHSPPTEHRAALENGDSFQPSNKHFPLGKGLPLLPQEPQSHFANSGFMNSTSTAHNYLCP
ncbi:immunoglobulin superfamily DCC subclass member 4 isoform X2 [Amia ocellicauda]|uniref:immunoglobulin superfamily DCC subclass member 4 isoform X2 n=1 Tax=Amia ocellicauda TaxID=2972642 RepID=UPI003464B7DB